MAAVLHICKTDFGIIKIYGALIAQHKERRSMRRGGDEDQGYHF
jgi:hypothetical protein